MWLQVANLHTKLVRGNDAERIWLREYLTFTDNTKRFRNKGGTSDVSMFNEFSSSFPTGLLSVTRRAANEEGMQVMVQDARVAPCEQDEQADLAWLYDYQREAVEKVADCARGIIWCPTGCLTGDTRLIIKRGRGVRILELSTVVRRLNNVPARTRSTSRKRLWDLTIPTFTQSVDSEGVVQKNRIIRGWSNGVAPVHKVVTAGGRRLRATAAHRFMLPNGTFRRLHDLREGSQIMVIDTASRIAIPDTIRFIRYVGDEEVFDLEMESPWQNYCANGMVVHNSGKTEIAVGLTRALPCRWLFLVHRAGLMRQAADRFELRSPGLTAGRIGEGSWDVPDDASFICATFQTIHKKVRAKDQGTLDLLAGAEGIMVDECHTLPAESFWNTVMHTRDAYFRVGLSGTPLARGDRKTLLSIAALGPVVYRIKSQKLIDRGTLARPTVRLVEVRQKSTRPKWQGVYGESIVRSPKRNKAVVMMCKQATKPSMLFVKEIKHGKLLEKELWREGVKCAFVWGTHSSTWREDAIKQLVTGRIDLLITSVVFQEGVDVPELRSVVVASAGKSVIATLQRLGRGMRVERDADGAVVPGGDQFEVWDIADLGCGCKEDTSDGTHPGCKWLEKHTKVRLHAYASENYETVVTKDTRLVSK